MSVPFWRRERSWEAVAFVGYMSMIALILWASYGILHPYG